MKSYIHATLDMEYGWEGNEPSEPHWAFFRLQTKLAEREKALRVAIIEVSTL